MNRIKVFTASLLLVAASVSPVRSQTLQDIQTQLDRIESNQSMDRLLDANAAMQDASAAATQQFNLLMEQYARSTPGMRRMPDGTWSMPSH